jgi:hypothetical protein
VSMEPLDSLTSSGTYNAHALPAILRELQGLRFTFADGDTSGQPIDVDGIEPGDVVASVLNMTDSVPVNGSVSIDSEGDAIAIVGSTASKKLLVVWFDKSGAA